MSATQYSEVLLAAIRRVPVMIENRWNASIAVCRATLLRSGDIFGLLGHFESSLAPMSKVRHAE